MMNRKPKGFLLIAGLVLIILVGIMGVMVSHITTANTDIIVTDYTPTIDNENIAEAAFNIATGGLMTSTLNIRQNCEGVATDAPVSFSNGEYEITTTLYYPTSPGTLVSIVGSTLTMTSTTGYAPKGAVQIDNEYITYTGIVGTTLTGITRGAMGSTQATHVTGSIISQNLCYVEATSYVPDKDTATHTQTISGYVPLEEGWAGGQVNLSEEAIQRYKNGVWTRYGPGSLSNKETQGVTSNSYQDAWMVGQNRSLWRWLGNGWSQATYFSSSNYGSYSAYYDDSSASNTRYHVYVPDTWFNGIDCTNVNNCWAVGNRNQISSQAGGKPNDRKRATIIKWDGNIWARDWPDSNAYENLYDVSCASSDFCVAVGDNETFFEYKTGNNSVNWDDMTTANSVKDRAYMGVSCPSSSVCFAVGVQVNNQGATIAQYNGTQWSDVSNSLPNITYNAIDCPATNLCFAVGDKDSNYMTIAVYNGSTWSRVPRASFVSDLSSGEENLAVSADLYGIHCASSTNCIAVGTNKAHVHYNGTTWYLDVSYTGSSSHLYGVTNNYPPSPEILFREES